MLTDARRWQVTERLTEGPLVLVGSSLGGWLSVITALKLKHRLHGLGNLHDINTRQVLWVQEVIHFYIGAIDYLDIQYKKCLMVISFAFNDAYCL